MRARNGLNGNRNEGYDVLAREAWAEQGFLCGGHVRCRLWERQKVDVIAMEHSCAEPGALAHFLREFDQHRRFHRNSEVKNRERLDHTVTFAWIRG